jgi:hypothetical protein
MFNEVSGKCCYEIQERYTTLLSHLQKTLTPTKPEKEVFPFLKK